MRYVTIIWDADNDQGGNVQHIAEHGLTVEDVEFVLENAVAEDWSKSSGRPCVFGYTPGGEYIIVLFDEIDAQTIYPVTAYEVAERN